MSVRSDRVLRVWAGLGGIRPWMVAPWVMSVAVHAALVSLAFFVVWSVTTPRAPIGPPAMVSFFDPAPARLSIGQTDPDEPEDDEREGEEPERAMVAPAELPSASMILEQALGGEPVADGPEPRAPDDLSALMYERRFPEVEFFGMGSGDAESIVYVVDGSGSMVSTLPWLKRELGDSIRKLAPTQRFQVVFFQGDPETGEAGAVASPHPSQPGRTRETLLIRATRANVADVLRWIGSIRARGRSNPLRALEVALALEPEVVFLLSNTITGAGEWEVDGRSILARLEELNPRDPGSGNRPVAIKVIGLPPEDPSGLLRRIGELHGGEGGYTYIDRDEVGKSR